MGNKNSGSCGAKSTAEQVSTGCDCTGKTVVVTGANTGIGKETSRVLAKRGATVYMLIRNEKKGEAAKSDIIKSLSEDKEFISFINKSEKNETESKNKEQPKELLSKRLILMNLDLSSLKSIFEFSKKFTALNVPIHCLINNAGIYEPPKYTETKDGFESQFGVNHLGHFYLTNLVLPILLKNKARIVTVSSMAHNRFQEPLDKYIDDLIKNECGPSEKGYNASVYYGLSKACNILFARGLNYQFGKNRIKSEKKEDGDYIETVSLHPGVVQTELFRENKTMHNTVNSGIGKLFLKTVEQGAATSVICALMTSENIKNGGFYSDCQFADDKLIKQLQVKQFKNQQEYKESMECKLWNLSEMLIKKKGFPMDVNQNIDEKEKIEEKENVFNE